MDIKRVRRADSYIYSSRERIEKMGEIERERERERRRDNAR